MNQYGQASWEVHDTFANDYLPRRAAYGDCAPPGSNIFWNRRHDELTLNEWHLFSLNRETPAASIIIPTDVLKEPYSNLQRTLAGLSVTCREIGPTEVIIWSSSRVNHITETGKGTPGDYNRALRVWEAQRNKIKTRYEGQDLLRIRMNHNFMSHADDLNVIRSRYMDAVCFDAGIRGMPLSHAIVWLDADTPFMGRHALNQLIAPLRNKEAHFAHANLLYVGDTIDAPPWSQREDCEKVAAVYGLARQMIERNLQPTDNRGYVDESGLAFTIGSYLASGGIGIRNPQHGETRTLLARAKEVLDPTIPLITYVRKARIGTSYRRIRLLAKTLRPQQLPLCEDGDDYVAYQSMAEDGVLSSPQQGRTTHTAVQAMVTEMDQRQELRTGTTLSRMQRERLAKTITRFGFAD